MKNTIAQTQHLSFILLFLLIISCKEQRKTIIKDIGDKTNTIIQDSTTDTLVNNDSLILNLDTTKFSIIKKAAPMIYTTVDEMPSFPGGQSELSKYLDENLKFPKDELEMGIQGRFTVQFVITKTGKIENAVLKRGVSPKCDEEFLRVINNMPKWNPGIHNSKRVSTYYTFAMYMPRH